MKVYRPIKSNQKGQGFGENLSCCRVGADNKPLRPFKIVNAISNNVCPVGSVPFYQAIGMLGHNGEDWSSVHGEPVYFPVVAGVEWEAASEVDADGGIGVNVRSKTPVALENLPPQAQGSLNLARAQYNKLGGKVYIYFKFWHLKSHNVYDKKPVKAGDLIGWADSTGASGGDHLHWSMKISDETSWFCLDGDNGYVGAVDFSQWFENKFILDTLSNPSEPTPYDKLMAIADDLEKQGKTQQARIVRAVAGIIKAFGV